MRTWKFALFCLACLPAAGCRTDPNVALLERENRDLEDEIYALQDLIEKGRRENDALREQLGGSGEQTGSPDDLTLPPGITEPARRGGRRESGAPLRLDALPSPNPQMPSQEMPAEEFLERFIPGAGGPPKTPGVQPAFPPPADSAPSGPELPEPVPAPQGHENTNADPAADLQTDNSHVAFITLHRLRTGGYDTDGQAGDEGVAVLLEPRDADGRLIAAAASVSIVVLDPALSGRAARVARWDFTAAEFAAKHRKTPSGEGFLINMLWPAAPPQHGRLHLFVRYTTDDGRALEADREIHVDRIGDLAQRWSPVSSTRPAGLPSRAAERQHESAHPVENRPAEPIETAALPIDRPAPAPAAREPATSAPAVSESAAPATASRLPRPVWSPERR